ncbi:MAG: MarR family transcriptional regulator [Candidatus Firestonebacteria bacterium]
MDELFDRVEIIRRKFMRIMPRMNSSIIMPKEGKESCSANLTISELKTLFLFKEQPTYKMSKIAEFVGMPMPTATHVVDRMVRDGLLKRSLDDKDRRVVNIDLTEKGRKKIENSDNHHRESMKRFLNILEPKDREKLIKAMENFVAVIEEIGEKINLKGIKKEGSK